MKINLVGQPYSCSSNLYQFIASSCANNSYSRLRFATAWAKQSGISRVEKDIQTFRGHGNQVMAIVGISEGGATRQGLHLVHEICDASYVFHDIGRTFHPKIYFFSGEEEWSLFVGSNNFTAGGVFWNYETALEISGSFTAPEDAELANQVTNLFEKTIADSEVCKPLTQYLIKQLIESPIYRIGDEIRMAKRKNSTAQEGGKAESVFGKSAYPKKGDPKGPKSKRTNESLTPDPSRNLEPAALDFPSEPSEILTHSWFKKMSASDAQRPKGQASKPTGSLKLTQAQHPIDQKTYFRQIFFSNAAWNVAQTTDRGIQEKATVPIEVLVGTTSMGTFEVVVDHASYRIAGQGNVPTWLHWGERLTAYLKSNDHVNDHVTIEAFADGSFRLTISSEPIGEIRVSELGY